MKSLPSKCDLTKSPDSILRVMTWYVGAFGTSMGMAAASAGGMATSAAMSTVGRKFKVEISRVSMAEVPPADEPPHAPPDAPPAARASKPHLAQLDGLRGPLCVGVIAINMNLYDLGANLPVGVFLIASSITAFLAYGERAWDDASQAYYEMRDATEVWHRQRRLSEDGKEPGAGTGGS